MGSKSEEEMREMGRVFFPLSEGGVSSVGFRVTQVGFCMGSGSGSGSGLDTGMGSGQ